MARGVAVLVGLCACGRIGFGDQDADQAACAFDICDGFESDVIDTSLWTSMGTVSIDTTVAHHGSASVHLQTPVLAFRQAGISTITETKTLATSSPTYWVRLWYRLGGLPVGTNALELMFSEQVSAPQNGVYLFVHAADTQVYSGFDNGYATDNQSPPLDTWFCLIWNVVPQSSNTGVLGLSSDVVAPLTYTGVTNGTPPIRTISLGLSFDRPNVDVTQPILDAWIDDVIINSTAVTCAD